MSHRDGVSNIAVCSMRLKETMLKMYLVVANERIEEAYIIFKSARAEASNPTGDRVIRAEFSLLHAQIVHEKHNAVSFKDFLTHPSLRRRTLAGVLTLFGGQAAGTQVINSKNPKRQFEVNDCRYLTRKQTMAHLFMLDLDMTHK
jgi:hypothetical protein